MAKRVRVALAALCLSSCMARVPIPPPVDTVAYRVGPAYCWTADASPNWRSDQTVTGCWDAKGKPETAMSFSPGTSTASILNNVAGTAAQAGMLGLILHP